MCTDTKLKCAGVGNYKFVCLEEAPDSDAFQGTALDLYNYTDPPGQLQSSSSRMGSGRQTWTAFPSLSLIHTANLKK